MTRIAGRRGRIYLSPTNGAVAVPVTAASSFTIDLTNDTIDTTAMGDTTRQFVSDLGDVSGSWNGFWDDVDSAGQVLTAAQDGLSRNWYCYLDTAALTKYWYGSILISGVTQDGGVGNAVTANVTWKAASNITFKSS